MIRSNAHPRLSRLDDRIVPAAVSWDGGAGTTNWTDPANWSGDVLPGADDDVTIDVPSTTILMPIAARCNSDRTILRSA